MTFFTLMSFPILFMQSIFCGSLKACLLENWLPTAKTDASVFLNTQFGVKIASSVKELITPDLIQKSAQVNSE